MLKKICKSIKNFFAHDGIIYTTTGACNLPKPKGKPPEIIFNGRNKSRQNFNSHKRISVGIDRNGYVRVMEYGV